MKPFTAKPCPDGSVPITQDVGGAAVRIAETFGPARKQIAARIALLLNLSNDVPTDQLAKQFAVALDHKSESARMKAIYDGVDLLLARNIRSNVDAAMALYLLTEYTVRLAGVSMDGDRATMRDALVSALNANLKRWPETSPEGA